MSHIEKLADTERHLDVSKGYSLRAEDKTDELKQLNRSIFRPVITFNKDSKRAAQEAKIQARYDEERDAREKAMMDIRETQDRLGRAATYGVRGDEEGIGGGSGRFRTQAELQVRKNQRSKYQFEADEEDDQLEDELDDNLDEIMDVTKRLKALGSAMSSELDTQNERITRITDKTDRLDNHIFRNTERVRTVVLLLQDCVAEFHPSIAQQDQVDGIHLACGRALCTVMRSVLFGWYRMVLGIYDTEHNAWLSTLRTYPSCGTE